MSSVLRRSELESSVGLQLVEFRQHATELHVNHYRVSHGPDADVSFVDGAGAALSIPPAGTECTVVVRIIIVVAVRSAELPSVGYKVWQRRRSHRIASVSAVSGHRQPVLTDLSKYDSY